MNDNKTLSSLYKNCKEKLFNVTARKKKTKLKIAFNFQGKFKDKFNLTML